MKFFLDTYALIEIAEGNDDFKKYLESESITLKNNLVELYYFLLKKYGEDYANKSLQLFSKIAADYEINIIPEATKLRLKEKKKNFSYIDCLGYIFSRKYNYAFLTGDRSFSKFEGVEIVR